MSLATFVLAVRFIVRLSYTSVFCKESLRCCEYFLKELAAKLT